MLTWFYFVNTRERREWRHVVGVVLPLCHRGSETDPPQQVLPDPGWSGAPLLCIWPVPPDLVLYYHGGNRGTDCPKEGRDTYQ